jgi:bile acid:Na+ symporter, BASS family
MAFDEYEKILQGLAAYGSGGISWSLGSAADIVVRLILSKDWQTGKMHYF